MMNTSHHNPPEKGESEVNIGKAVKLCRNQKGFTKTKLAELSGLSLSYFTLLEQGKRDPSISTVERISDALGIPAFILIFLATENDERNSISTELLEKLSHLTLFLMQEN